MRILFNAAQNVTPDTDAKLKELKKLIAAKVAKPTTNKLGEPNQKVLVFTAFADTATYLYESLVAVGQQGLGHPHRACLRWRRHSHDIRKSAFNQILTNFSPRSKSRTKIPTMPQDGEIDLMIATDCISEGQNLQDCDYLVNYDIHWNPVRIIQRFGRIDRIGSASHAVQLVNFWPTDDLNKYINLKNRVEARMALVDIAATFEDNILQNTEIEELIHEDLRYRDKQLLRLKDEVLDLEDLGDSVSLTEFTLDDFRLELLKYIEANRASARSCAVRPLHGRPAQSRNTKSSRPASSFASGRSRRRVHPGAEGGYHRGNQSTPALFPGLCARRRQCPLRLCSSEADSRHLPHALFGQERALLPALQSFRPA